MSQHKSGRNDWLSAEEIPNLGVNNHSREVNSGERETLEVELKTNVNMRRWGAAQVHPKPRTNISRWESWESLGEKPASTISKPNTGHIVNEERFPDYSTKTPRAPASSDIEAHCPNIENYTSDISGDLKRLAQGGKSTPEENQVLKRSTGTAISNHMLQLEHVATERVVQAAISSEARCTQFQSSQSYPYLRVSVLLLYWEEGDLDLNWAIDGLQAVFSNDFGFEPVNTFRIPSHRPYSALEQELQFLKNNVPGEDGLLIIYYAGHGYLDRQNRMHWDGKAVHDGPALDWYALQVGLERAAPDVLILLDACHSAGASNLASTSRLKEDGRTEIIAAAGYDQTTSGPCSFTAALIGELKRMALHDPDFENCISAAQLHQGLLQSMLHQTLPNDGDPGTFVTSAHRFSTPVYITLNSHYSQPSIPLKRFRPRVAPSPGSSINDDPRHYRSNSIVSRGSSINDDPALYRSNSIVSTGSSVNDDPRHSSRVEQQVDQDMTEQANADHPKAR